jgi:hypothetical protein
MVMFILVKQWKFNKREGYGVFDHHWGYSYGYSGEWRNDQRVGVTGYESRLPSSSDHLSRK